MPSDLAKYWALDPDVLFLNHGSFGATPRAVLEHQQTLRDRMEADPVGFLTEGGVMREALDDSRARLASFVGAHPDNIVFVQNATEGVNAVLRSLDFGPGDELVTLNHEYNACVNCMRYITERTGATLRILEVPTPVQGPEDISARVLESITERTKLFMISHITSPTAMVLPVESLVPELEARGVMTLVDGAHAPGMVPLALDELGASFYTGNLHKWVCAPKGVGMLHVRPDRQELIHPAVISHGMNTRRPGRSLFHDEFDWCGTVDFTPWLCAGFTIDYMEQLVPGGWDAIRAHNRDLALRARDLLCARLGATPVCPSTMIGSIAAVRLSDDPGEAVVGDGSPNPHPLLRTLQHQNVRVPIIPWPAFPGRLLRVSAQLYNSIEDYERLADIVVSALAHEAAGTPTGVPCA